MVHRFPSRLRSERPVRLDNGGTTRVEPEYSVAGAWLLRPKRRQGDRESIPTPTPDARAGCLRWMAQAAPGQEPRSPIPAVPVARKTYASNGSLGSLRQGSA